MNAPGEPRDSLKALGDDFAAAEQRIPVRRRPSPVRAGALGALVVAVLVAVAVGGLGSSAEPVSDEAPDGAPRGVAKAGALRSVPYAGRSTALRGGDGRPGAYDLNGGVAGFVVPPRSRLPIDTRDLRPIFGTEGGVEASEAIQNLGLLLGGSLGGLDSLAGGVRDDEAGRLVLPPELRPPCEGRLDGNIVDHPRGGIETPRRAALGGIYLIAKRLDVVPDLERVGPSSGRARLFAVRAATGETVIVAAAVRTSNGAWRSGPFSACDWRPRR